MAEAKKLFVSSKPAKVSKRKAGAARKTKKAKTKITKTTVSVPEKTKITGREKQERVLTDRHKRMVEKARVRKGMPAKELPPEIEAVKITDIAGVVYDVDEYQAMVDMYDSTIKDIKEGEVVAGKVMGVNRNDVIVDVGFKSEGVISINEFPKPLNISVGENIDVFLEQIEDVNGQLILSKQKADFMRVWDRIREVHDSGDQIEGRVIRRIKGGLVVDIQGVDAFLPGSQVALRQVPDFDALISQIMPLKIIKINKNRRNIVVSRRMILEEERDVMRTALLSEIGIGQIRQGVVKNITDFGVFVDLGGVDGLLHITDMSWGRIRHPSEVASLGETIDVKVLDFDERTSRISLGLKQMTPYPWENIEQKYPLGKKITGRVVSITDYGAFVELEKGVEGLIHISEMSWTQHIKHPSKIMNANDQVETVVLSVDKDNEKISLGIKQMEPDPWTTIEEKYPPNKVVSGKVRNLTAFGAFVELEEGIDGLVHISDMSWTRRIQHPSEVMKKNDEVEIKILKVDHEHRRISLGYKQLTQDPWPEIARRYAVGTDCLGTITKVMDRGVLVDLDGDIEAFVPTSQLGHKELKDASEIFAEGESIPLQVIELEKKQRKVVLSVSAYYKKREKTELEEFLVRHKAKPTTLGDAMPEDLKSQVSDVEKTPAKTPETEAAIEAETTPAQETTDDTPAQEVPEETDADTSTAETTSEEPPDSENQDTDKEAGE
ncbi:MAG: 30S ribosomal protein S1 [candidate division Zixibacteria bacterium]|nr:30S ribosomal protein S1 [candidate division Zixibacteria bacterium]